MPCCSSQVILKRSSRGTQFFAHKVIGQCSTAPETETHLRLKRLAVERARANGWDAGTEVAGTTPEGEQWKADVLAHRGKHKVAIEIQWSPQTNEETVRRQYRYAQSGVRCLWLLRQTRIPCDLTLPAAGIGGDARQGLVARVPTGYGEQQVSMEEFLDAAFSRRLRFGVPLGASARVSILTGNVDCWHCGAKTQIVTGVELCFGPHSYQFSVPNLGHYPELFEIIRAHLPTGPLIGAIKHRFSKTQERHYLSNGCAHCNVLIGEFYEHEGRFDEIDACTFTICITEPWRQAILAESGPTWGWGVYPHD